MFLVNGVYGILAGTWALIFSTLLSLAVSLWVLGRPPIMPFIAGAVSIGFGTLTIVTGNAMWVQIKVTLFNALVALLLWLGLRSGKSFFRFVFGNTFHYTEEGWYKLTHIIALNRVFTGIDIWILFKIFIIMPATGLFFWWQVRLLQRYRLPEPV